jgi:molybdopterin-guanine dinucleotide biosynthesis protein MobB
MWENAMKGLEFLSVLGWSGTGKTTLIVGLVEELARRGLRCAVVKKSRHEAELQPAAKDSRLFLEAGARRSLYISGKEGILFLTPPEHPNIAWVADLAGDVDFVLIEGLELEGVKRALIGGRAASEAELKRPFGSFEILISDSGVLRELAARKGTISFIPSDVVGLVDYLMEGA